MSEDIYHEDEVAFHVVCKFEELIGKSAIKYTG